MTDGTSAIRAAGSRRVLVVDDSPTYRAIVQRVLQGEQGLEVIGVATSGEEALARLDRDPPDLITLDVEMPGMGGLAALEGIMAWNQRHPDRRIGVVMVSGHTTSGADSTLRALALGAFDFVTKPVGGSQDDGFATLKSQLPVRLRCCALTRGHTGRFAKIPSVPAPPRPPVAPRRCEAILIASSTGGPKALLAMLPLLTARTDRPMLIVQHMPASFTAAFAQQLGKVTGWPSEEAAHHAPIQPRRLYVAPGGRHLGVARLGLQVVTTLSDAPAECGVRPAADVLFRHAAQVWRGDVMVVVLTGMGHDGTEGLRPLRAAGAPVIVQDEATSVVWGMPGSALRAGLTDEVAPLLEIPDRILRRLPPRRP